MVNRQPVIAIIGAIYGIWLLYSAGWVYWMILSILYILGSFFYFKARKEQGKKPFDKTWEAVVCAALFILAIVAIVLTANGTVVWF